MATRKNEVPPMSANDVAAALSKAGIRLFRDYPGLHLNQLQRNLEGRNFDFDDTTIKASKAQIHMVTVLDEGLILGVLESLQKTANPADGRVFRPVFFDVFGNAFHRQDVADSFESQKQAMSEFWREADNIDAVKTTQDGAKAKQEAMQKALDTFTELVEDLQH